jgi:hypothetical protein
MFSTAPSRAAENATRLLSGVQAEKRLRPGSVVKRWSVSRVRSKIQMSLC